MKNTNKQGSLLIANNMSVQTGIESTTIFGAWGSHSYKTRHRSSDTRTAINYKLNVKKLAKFSHHAVQIALAIYSNPLCYRNLSTIPIRLPDRLPQTVQNKIQLKTPGEVIRNGVAKWIEGSIVWPVPLCKTRLENGRFVFGSEPGIAIRDVDKFNFPAPITGTITRVRNRGSFMNRPPYSNRVCD